MYDPMPSAYAACAANEDRQMSAGERYAKRLDDRRRETVAKWRASDPLQRASDMRDAFDYRDYDARLFGLLMQMYDQRHPEAVDLVNDMAACWAEITTDAQDNEE